ncbi:hypothetical protein VTJ04DRAFT_3073 [Mycothermus thermophilus]|uniref:uncharacterized protein n=1 Tax=Humicola insolens TaxID=85995 RepID=UPI00374304DE
MTPPRKDLFLQSRIALPELGTYETMHLGLYAKASGPSEYKITISIPTLLNLPPSHPFIQTSSRVNTKIK